jgi:hypothetical protein
MIHSKRKRGRRAVRILKAVTLTAALALTFAVVWLRSSIVTLEYTLSDLDNRKKIVMRDGKLLAAEKARLSSIARFDGAAGHGFVMPNRVQVVHVTRAAPGDAHRASFPVK